VIADVLAGRPGANELTNAVQQSHANSVYVYDREALGASRKRCMNTRSILRPNFCRPPEN